MRKRPKWMEGGNDYFQKVNSFRKKPDRYESPKLSPKIRLEIARQLEQMSSKLSLESQEYLNKPVAVVNEYGLPPVQTQ